jgi:hypothetical protein
MWTGLDWHRIGSDGELCEYDNKTLSSIKGVEFIDWLSKYRLLKEDLAPWKINQRIFVKVGMNIVPLQSTKTP